MVILALTAFWLSLAVLAYGYGGFPVVSAVVGRLRARPVRKEPITPTVSLIITAYNEEDGIGQRVENALASDYPAGLLEVIVASDGSTDATEAIVSRFDQERVRLLCLPRRGKAFALETAVRHSRGEILVFSDANAQFEPPALRMLVRNFADPEVGGVAGCTGYLEQDGGESAGSGESLYWRYDTWLKGLESRTGSIVSAHGGMYAIRRELFRPIEDPAITDDFAVSTGVVAQGRRLVFEPEARSYEVPVRKTSGEFRRRVRLMTRGLRGVFLRRSLLNPVRYGVYSLLLFSHKVLRRLLVLFLPLLFLSSVALHGRGGIYLGAAGAQAVFYALAGMGWALRGRRVGHWKVFYVPFFYCMANLASAVALWNVARGRRIARWNPQRHEAEAESPRDDATPEPAGPSSPREPLSGPGPIDALLRDALEELRQRGASHCVLGRPENPESAPRSNGDRDGPAPSPARNVEILVAAEDASFLEGVFLDRDFVLFPPGSKRWRSHLLGRDPAGRGRLRVDVRTELRYGGPTGYLRLREDPGSVLARGRIVKGEARLSPPDALVDLLLHLLFDRRRICSAGARGLRSLVRELRTDPPLAGRAAERVQQELAPALTWDRLLDLVRKEDWEGLLRRRAAVAFHLARSDPFTTLGRTVSGTASRLGLGRLPSPLVRSEGDDRGRRGGIVAIIAPHGDRRTTVARGLVDRLPAPSLVVHGGHPRPHRRFPTSLHRPASLWARAAFVRWLRAMGHVVVIDRSGFEGTANGNGLDATRRGWRHRLLEWPFPEPDLVVVLDTPRAEAPPRTGEHAPAIPEGGNGNRFPHPGRSRGVLVVDATRPEDDVVETIAGQLGRKGVRWESRARWAG